ncbi:hypothetical protein T439DRAFT_379273 [Meredithblackwellia eburnea MCA 4105]
MNAANSIRTIAGRRGVARLQLTRSQYSKQLLRRPFSSSTPRPSQSQSHQRQGPSPTAIFYRHLVPSMIQCLAIGSIVYYALELLHNTLDRERIIEELQAKVDGLERELQEKTQGRKGLLVGMVGGRNGDSLETGAGKSWWKFW